MGIMSRFPKHFVKELQGVCEFNENLLINHKHFNKYFLNDSNQNDIY